MRMTEKEYEELINRRKKEKLQKNRKKNKYRSNKAVYDGIAFDSQKEADRYAQLLLLAKAGEITELVRQPSFELIPTQRDKDGNLLERRCSYYADFSYKDKNGNLIVEDVKSPATSTPQYRIKRKLMLHLYGIRVKEI